MKDYNKENIPLAKTLRKNMTPWERKLWYDFLRYYPVRFQRLPLKGKAFPFRPRSGHLTYSLFTILYYLLSNPPLAPSDEGAVSAADWGREPGSVFPQRR